MSIRWVIDYGRSPVLVRGECTLLVCERVGHDEIMSVVTSQAAWWNRQHETISLYGDSYHLRFRIGALLASESDPVPGDNDLVWRLPELHSGPVCARLTRYWRYRGGVAVVLAGGNGLPGSRYTRTISHFTGTAVINWTESDLFADRDGVARSVNLAHEIGHAIGFMHTYDGGPQERNELDLHLPGGIREGWDSRGHFRTHSFPGWERNMMADVESDRHRDVPSVGGGRRRVFLPGPAWLGPRLATNIVRRVLAAQTSGISSALGIPYFYHVVGRPQQRPMRLVKAPPGRWSVARH